MSNDQLSAPPVENPELVDEYERAAASLYDYTKFHIGLYSAIISATVAFSTISGYEVQYFLAGVAVFSFTLAGGCGGMICSSLPVWIQNREPASFFDFDAKAFGFIERRCSRWATLEHRWFWLGLVCLFLAIVGGAPEIPERQGSPTPEVTSVSPEAQNMTDTTNDVTNGETSKAEAADDTITELSKSEAK